MYSFCVCQLQATSQTHEAGGVTGLQCDNQLSNVQFSFSFFSASSDVPRDSEDRRIDEERQREYARLKEQKRKERKEAKDREKKEKEKEEQRLSQLKALSQRQLTVNSARPASTRSVMSVVNSARKPSS
ncbi:hypothetical protein DIPPA_24135 [Diplonema papillatum]|nr:hypothetical protein DIPPA_24135 [Diplonema papillatum]